MKIPVAKLKAMILYFGTHSDQRFLGKTKLMKLFYFADFMHIKRYGSSITSDKYFHLEHGPIPTTIKNLVDSATDDIDNSVLADTIKIEPNGGQLRIVPIRTFSEADGKWCSEKELETLERVCSRFGSVNKQTIEDASHKEAPWTETGMFEEISYSLALLDPDCEISESDFDLLQQITF